MQNVLRYDRLDLPQTTRTDEGYLVAPGFVVRPGVMTYLRGDGSTVRELVPEEEIARPEAIASLMRKPVTLGHPHEDVNPDNIAEYGVGDVGAVWVDEQTGFLVADIAIRRADAIQAVDSGTQQLSPGYLCDVVFSAGVHPKHGPYDAIQTNRRYNHLAIVDRARGGTEIRLRLDDAEVVMPSEDTEVLAAVEEAPSAETPSEVETCATEEKIDATVEIEIEAAEEPVAMESEEKMDAWGKLCDALGLDAKMVDASMSTIMDMCKSRKSDEDVAAYVDERIELLTLADQFHVTVNKMTDNKELRKTLACALQPQSRTDASDEYYRAVLDVTRTDAKVPGSLFVPVQRAPQLSDRDPSLAGLLARK